jgi:hypothetical protein
MADAFEVVGSNPLITGVFVALVVMLFARAAFVRRNPKQRDTRRAFTNSERMMGFERANKQCEYTRWVFFRCTRTATHGDHYIPWSKGGATNMANFAASCARCNLRKSAHIPSVLSRTLLAARRAKYFPVGIPRSAGQKVMVRA